jgi:hypothetical protein
MDDAHFVGVEPDKVTPKACDGGKPADAGASFGRRLHDPFLDQRDHYAEFGIVAVIGRTIRRRVPRQFGTRQAAAARQQISSLAPGQEIVDLAQHDLQAVTLKLHVLDDLGLEQRHRVGRGRIAKTGMEFIGHRCAADLLRGLKNRDLKAALG